MWFGLAIGYAYHYGLFAKIEMGANRATTMESKFPFKRFVERPYFLTAGDSMGGEILPSSMGRSSATDSSVPAAEAASSGSASTAASNNSAAAGFKAFSGKGKSLSGGNPAAPPRFDH